jgi:hypothetical protein
MIDGTPAITITLSIQKPGAPDTLLMMRSAAFGDTRHAQARLVHLGAGRLHPFVQMASARGSVSIGAPNAFAMHSAVMSLWVGPIPPVVKT